MGVIVFGNIAASDTLRALAFKWIRILFACWKNRQPYDENRYLQQLRSKGVSYLTMSPSA